MKYLLFLGEKNFKLLPKMCGRRNIRFRKIFTGQWIVGCSEANIRNWKTCPCSLSLSLSPTHTLENPVWTIVSNYFLILLSGFENRWENGFIFEFGTSVILSLPLSWIVGYFIDVDSLLLFCSIFLTLLLSDSTWTQCHLHTPPFRTLVILFELYPQKKCFHGFSNILCKKKIFFKLLGHPLVW